MVKHRMFLFQKSKLKKKINLTRNTEILTAADATGLKKGQKGFFEMFNYAEIFSIRKRQYWQFNTVT